MFLTSRVAVRALRKAQALLEHRSLAGTVNAQALPEANH